MRVLFVGSSSNAVIEPLAGCLRAADPDIHITTAGLTEPPNYARAQPREGSAISEVVRELDPRVVFAQRRGGMTATSPSGSAPASSAGRAQHLAKALYSRFGSVLTPYVRRSLRGVLEGSYDLIHLHSLFRTPVHEALCGHRGTPLVVSCWGSDVFRTSEMRLLALQQRVLRRADAITASGPEFREVVLSKYGRDLGDRIHSTFFAPGLETVLGRDAAAGRRLFCDRHGLPGDRKILCVGHSGFPEGQHVDLIRGLEVLAPAHREGLQLVVPMTYGCGDDYRRAVATAAESAGFPATIVSEYMTDDQMAEMRCASDILLYAPTSDAFSASVSQALAVGTVCVVGSWLPYKTRHRAGFRFWEIDHPSDSGVVLAPLLERWEESLSECAVNRGLSVDFFDPERLGRGWLDAYEAAIDRFATVGADAGVTA